MNETTAETQKLCWHCYKQPQTYPDAGLCNDCFREVQHKRAVTEALPKAFDAIDALKRLADTKAGREAIAQALERTHRTEQQLVCRALVEMLWKWNEDAKKGPGWYDARNEASVKFAEQVFERVPEKFRYFPYI